MTTTVTDHLVSNVTIRGNRLENVDTGDHPAIQVEGDSHFVQIVNNTIKNTSSIAIGIAGRPDIDQPTNILVKGNDITGHGSPGKHSAGIYLDGAGENIIVEENAIYGGQQGIKVSLEPTAADLQTNHVIVRRNLLYNNTQINLKLGVGDSDDNCTQAGQLEESVAVHNTIFTSLEEVTNHRFGCGENLRWKNNIFADMGDGTSFHYKSNDDDTTYSHTWLMDFNLFYSLGGNGLYRWSGVTFNSLSGFKAASGQDTNSLVGDPRFVDANAEDFQLESDSAARDAGGNLTFATSAGSGTVVPVLEAWYFTDGLGLQDGDRIRIGGNDPVKVVSVNYDNNTLTVDQTVFWHNQDSVNYDYEGNAPDTGALEFVPIFDLVGIPGDRAVYLRWKITEDLPETAVLQLQYTGSQGTPPSPIDNIPLSVDEYVLTGLENYMFYEITLSAIDSGVPLLTDTISVMPTDIYSFMPIIVRAKTP
ncbi:MAG: right-handed parallel beta-helix repeat-containing protein [Chloroflexi bacterium]|nr:right-handed parallel beta-helix repeat-containing protein [Chloroflexota bacterium]